MATHGDRGEWREGFPQKSQGNAALVSKCLVSTTPLMPLFHDAMLCGQGVLRSKRVKLGQQQVDIEMSRAVTRVVTDVSMKAYCVVLSLFSITQPVVLFTVCDLLADPVLMDHAVPTLEELA